MLPFHEFPSISGVFCFLQKTIRSHFYHENLHDQTSGKVQSSDSANLSDYSPISINFENFIFHEKFQKEDSIYFDEALASPLNIILLNFHLPKNIEFIVNS